MVTLVTSWAAEFGSMCSEKESARGERRIREEEKVCGVEEEVHENRHRDLPAFLIGGSIEKTRNRREKNICEATPVVGRSE